MRRKTGKRSKMSVSKARPLKRYRSRSTRRTFSNPINNLINFLSCKSKTARKRRGSKRRTSKRHTRKQR